MGKDAVRIGEVVAAELIEVAPDPLPPPEIPLPSPPEAPSPVQASREATVEQTGSDPPPAELPHDPFPPDDPFPDDNLPLACALLTPEVCRG